VREVIPDYENTCPMIVLPSILDRERLNVFSAVVQRTDGREERTRLPLEVYFRMSGRHEHDAARSQTN
jgi:hypothetical protein